MKFIQIGAHIGKDRAFDIVKNEDIELGILVEPLPHLLPKLQESYKNLNNIVIENQAISNGEGDVVSFYYDKKDPITELSSMNKQHLIKHNVKEEDIGEIEIPSTSLGNLLNKYKIDELDYLFVDTEGFDYPILKSFDFTKSRIKTIIFEDVHTDGPFNRGKNYEILVGKFESEGYVVDKIDPSNTRATLKPPPRVIYRISDSGYNKTKPDYITSKKCLANATEVLEGAIFHVIADNTSPETNDMIQKYITKDGVEYVSKGNGASTFNLALDKALTYDDDEIIYFLENDYLHKPNSLKILEEGIRLGASFISLYDHPDKYLDPSKGGNPYCEGGAEDTRVYLTNSCHWKMTNSTTMTFAAKVSTLKRVEPILRKHTSGSHPNDFQMFLELREMGELLTTPIPGYSTHGETSWLSPHTDWSKI